MLRRAFVREVPVAWHEELHSILHDVPLPPEQELRAMWEAYQKDRDSIDCYDIVDTLGWLYNHSNDEGFRWAIKTQLYFFKGKLNA